MADRQDDRERAWQMRLNPIMRIAVDHALLLDSCRSLCDTNELIYEALAKPLASPDAGARLRRSLAAQNLAVRNI